MTLSLLPATLAVDTPIHPTTQVTNPSDFPKVEFQTNFVRTEYGSLTGMMELAIRVGPSGTQIDTATGKEIPVPVDFQAIAATLQFNTKLFKPVNWSWEIPEEEGAALPAVLPLNAQNYYDVQLPAMKDDTIPGTGAIAQCGIVQNPADMSDDVVSGDQALLFFKAESYGGSVAIGTMTTLAVVRFYVAPELMEHISIERDKKSFSAEWGYNYNVVFDGKTGDDNYIKTRDMLNDAIAATEGQTSADPDAHPDLMAALGLTTEFTAVDFAVDSDMAKSKSPANMSLDYSSGDNEFYFVPGCDPEDDNPDPNASTLTTVNVKINGNPIPLSLTAPKTEGFRVLAVDSLTKPTNYSYLTNLIPADNITFPVVSQLSFADKGDGRENMATVVFYDWDDTLIGVLVVPRKDDARALVNAYVRDNMIHPDLRYDEEADWYTARPGSTKPELINSMARLYTYRGRHPATGPAADGAVDSTVVSDGGDYPLTNKIDYAFLKRPLELTYEGVTDIGEPISTWTQPGEAIAEWDYEYPYIHGWALIPDDDLTDIQYTHPNSLWTTIGVGELTDYNGAWSGGYLELNKAPAELIAEGQKFEIADFNFREHSLGKGSVYAVKAIYEPGEDLLFNGNAYRMISEPYYNKMNYPTAAFGAAYSVEVVFERTNFDSDGMLHGVSRARDLALRQETTADIRWENEYLENATIAQQSAKTKTTFSTVPVDNVDEVEIQLVLSGRHNKVDYYLMEAYGASFVTGGERSRANSTFMGTAHTIDNYNYKTADNNVDRIYYQAEYVDTDGDGRVNDDRSGSYGFVLFCTLNNLAQKVTEYNNGI
ncbi:MAG: hypothetical protein K2F83_01975, partial [Oscillospiraceae bacterium]|nr:hypothetical protein [Oscillospiraceae bacterium]